MVTSVSHAYLTLAITHISSSGRGKVSKLDKRYTCSRRSWKRCSLGAGRVITRWSRNIDQYFYLHLYRGCGHRTWTTDSTIKAEIKGYPSLNAAGFIVMWLRDFSTSWTVDIELLCHLSPGVGDLIATSPGALTNTHLHFWRE